MYLDIAALFTVAKIWKQPKCPLTDEWITRCGVCVCVCVCVCVIWNDAILFSWAPKSLWMVTTAMKLKDTCSLEEKL